MRRLLAPVVLTLLALALPFSARAHCDALDGPVVTDGEAALKAGEVTPALRWVAAEDEAELKSAFQKTLAVRKKGPEARELADRWFFETLVRLHRASEGAPYTGLKPAGTDPGPAVRAADRALETGKVDALVGNVTRHVEQGIRERFESARRTRAKADDSVAAGRAWVRDYVTFVHYVEGLHQATEGAGHGEAEAHAAAD